MTPEGWAERSIADLVTTPVSYGVVQTGDPGADRVPCVRVVDLASGRLSPENMIMTSREVSESYRRTVLKKGDLMIALRGIIGRAALVTETLEGCNLTRGLARIAPDPRQTRSAFLLHYLNGPFFQKSINRQANGSALQEISIATLRDAKVLLPPVAEQVRVADVLSTWDRAIETAEALLAAARAQNGALMQQLLGTASFGPKKRLPGFSEAWSRQPIRAISSRVKRVGDGTKQPVLTISSTSGFVRQDQKYSRFMAGKSVESYVLLRRGEFAYNKGNSKTYQYGCVFDLADFESGLVPHVYVCFKLKPGLSHRFFKAVFEADYLKPQLGRLVNTGVRNNGLLNITPAQFLSTEVPVPPREEQEAIADVMEAASGSVLRLETQLAALRQEKAALMEQLLTGKRRVKLDSKEAAPCP